MKNKIDGWNYRIMVMLYKQGLPQQQEMYSMRQVYYDKNGGIQAYSANEMSLGGCSLKDMKKCLKLQKGAFKKPVLYFYSRADGDEIYENWKGCGQILIKKFKKAK